MAPAEIKDKTVLVAPLNWGLGHATRCWAIINELIKNNNKVILASDGEALEWLKREFPGLHFFSLPELKINYSKRGAISGILKRLPHFFNSIKKDFTAIRSIIKNQQVDIIISDNRYGVYHPQVFSVLLSHQLRLNHPLGKILNQPFRNYIEKFDEIWIPDDADHTYSGILSMPFEPLNTPLRFIGILSRFKRSKVEKYKYKYLLIASGPEPLRTQLSELIKPYFDKIDAPCAMVLGQNGESIKNKENKVELWTNLTSVALEELINLSETIICRSGYSSIMDMVVKKKQTIIIPTPGQPEQVYLADYHNNKNRIKSVFCKNDFEKLVI